MRKVKHIDCVLVATPLATPPYEQKHAYDLHRGTPCATEAPPKPWKLGTGLRYKRKGLRASNHWLNMGTGTRINALLLMGGAPSLLNNADHADSLLLSSETQRMNLCTLGSVNSIPMSSSQPVCFYTTPSCSIADFRDSPPPLQTRVPNPLSIHHISV